MAVKKRKAVTRVLVADDQRVFRSLARIMLEADGGFQVVAEAADGDKAVELVEEVKRDVVLMDVNMPRMNGLEATRRILARHPETKVVLISISSDEELLRASREAGAIAFILKVRLPAQTLREAIQAMDYPAISLVAGTGLCPYARSETR